jgi:hypothetical protein
MADPISAGRSSYAAATAVLRAALPAMPAPRRAQNAGLQVSSDAARSVDLRTAPEVPSVPPAGLVTKRPAIPIADYVATMKAR